MSTRSIEIHKMAWESEEKLDYFVCGVAGALFAYLGQNYAPRKLEIGVSALEPLALLFLVAAFFVGMKRIETAIILKHLNQRMLDAAEKAGNLAKALAASSGPYGNEEGGEVYDRETALTMRQDYLEKRDATQAALEPVKRKAKQLYKWRNRCLYLGFCAVFAAKLLQPYSSLKLSTTPATKTPMSITKTNMP
jgi:hypothetical protein